MLTLVESRNISWAALASPVRIFSAENTSLPTASERCGLEPCTLLVTTEATPILPAHAAPDITVARTAVTAVTKRIMIGTPRDCRAILQQSRQMPVPSRQRSTINDTARAGCDQRHNCHR